MNKELAKTLTLALVNYIDENRPDGTMDCSSGECVSLEKAFTKDDFNSVETLVNKKLRIPLTPFQQCLSGVLRKAHFVVVSEDELNDTIIGIIRAHTNDLLALAKKELLSYADESNPAIEAMADLKSTYFSNPDKLPKWLKDDIARKELNAHTKGYNKGYEVATKLYDESVAYHYPDPIPSGIPYQSPQCGTNVTIVPNTNSGTSILKAEG